MASTWGEAFGAAWGESWRIAAAVPAPAVDGPWRLIGPDRPAPRRKKLSVPPFPEMPVWPAPDLPLPAPTVLFVPPSAEAAALAPTLKELPILVVTGDPLLGPAVQPRPERGLHLAIALALGL
jgi:hypothetical protein